MWSTKVHLVKAMVFSVVMYGYESWTIKKAEQLKNWCFWTMVLQKALESPLDCKEIQPVHSKGDQSWVFIGRTNIEAETPILWPPDVKIWLIWKDPDAGKDWGQEEKGTTENKMVGWHHQINGHGFGWTPGVGDGEGGLACCGSWCRKELDMTERLNWTEMTHQDMIICNNGTKIYFIKNFFSERWEVDVILKFLITMPIIFMFQEFSILKKPSLFPIWNGRNLKMSCIHSPGLTYCEPWAQFSLKLSNIWSWCFFWS